MNTSVLAKKSKSKHYKRKHVEWEYFILITIAIMTAIVIIKTEYFGNDSSANPHYGDNEDQFNDLVGTEILAEMEDKATISSSVTIMEEEQQNADIEHVSAEQNEEVVHEDKTNDSNYNDYSEKDFEILAKIVYAESGNQSLEGMVAVGATILNRVESELFPDTIEEVVSQKGQFSSVKAGVITAFGEAVEYEELPESCKEAARLALEGQDPTEDTLGEGGALFFYNPRYTSQKELEKRENIENTVSIEDHVFYREW